MSQARASNSVGAAKCAIRATGARARVQSSTQSREIRKERHPNRSRRELQGGPRIPPECSLNGSKMAPKLLQNGSQRGPGALLEASWEPFGDYCPYFAPILPSSEPPGTLLDASGAEKKIS